MKRTLNRGIVALLLLVYGGVGVAGHLQVLTLLGAWDRDARVAPARVPMHKPGRVSLFQERHRPSQVTVSAPEPAIIVQLVPGRRTASRIAIALRDDAVPGHPAATRSPSRAPPLTPACF